MKYALVAALAMGLTACASAQSASSPPPEEADQGQMMGDRMGGQAMMGMARHTEGVLAFLKTELKITAAQTGAWDAFAVAYRDFAASMPHMPMQSSGMKGSGMMGSGMMGSDMMGGDGHASSFAERMEMHMAMMQSRLEALRKFNTALKPLYASLTKQQRKTADQILPMFMKMGHMM